jgi:hypothetical protein
VITLWKMLAERNKKKENEKREIDHVYQLYYKAKKNVILLKFTKW